jgi:hypothetical protein
MGMMTTNSDTRYSSPKPGKKSSYAAIRRKYPNFYDVVVSSENELNEYMTQTFPHWQESRRWEEDGVTLIELVEDNVVMEVVAFTGPKKADVTFYYYRKASTGRYIAISPQDDGFFAADDTLDALQAKAVEAWNDLRAVQGLSPVDVQATWIEIAVPAGEE